MEITSNYKSIENYKVNDLITTLSEIVYKVVNFNYIKIKGKLCLSEVLIENIASKRIKKITGLGLEDKIYKKIY